MTIHDCTLGGVSLSSLDKRICVLDFQEDAPAISLVTHALARGGQQLRQTRRSLTVRIHFAIHEANPSRRKAVLQTICSWAMQGGVLTLSDRAGKRLHVVCTALPAITSEDWTAPLSIAFTTTHCPWWEAVSPTSVSGNGGLTMTLPGTADFAPVDAQITNAGTQPLSLLTVRCGSSLMIFNGIDLPVGSVLTLTTTDGVFSAEIDGESVLHCRTAGSDDLLLAPCGKTCTVSATATQPLSTTFSARGRYA